MTGKKCEKKPMSFAHRRNFSKKAEKLEKKLNFFKEKKIFFCKILDRNAKMCYNCVVKKGFKESFLVFS